MNCIHCGQPLPLAAWLRGQSRTLWTSEELIARFGGAENQFGRDLATRKIRQRLPDRSLSKKRAIYCAKPDAVPAFTKATPRELASGCFESAPPKRVKPTETCSRMSNA
jgi:hypothetical protein